MDYLNFVIVLRVLVGVLVRVLVGVLAVLITVDFGIIIRVFTEVGIVLVI